MFSKLLSIRMQLRSSGSTEALDVLRPAQQLFWYWDLYNASSVVKVLEVEKEHRIYIEWDADTDNPSNVEWNFEDRAERGTYVSVVHSGFDMEAEDFIEQIVDVYRRLRPCTCGGQGLLRT